MVLQDAICESMPGSVVPQGNGSGTLWVLSTLEINRMKLPSKTELLMKKTMLEVKSKLSTGQRQWQQGEEKV